MEHPPEEPPRDADQDMLDFMHWGGGFIVGIIASAEMADHKYGLAAVIAGGGALILDALRDRFKNTPGQQG